MKRQSSGAAATLMETKSSVAGAGAIFIKRSVQFTTAPHP